MKLILKISVVAVMLAGGTVRAEAQVPAAAPEIVSVGTPADVENKDVVAIYEAIRRSPKLERPAVQKNIAPIEETRGVVEQRVEELIDGSVLVSRPVDPALEPQLVLMGVRRVTDRADAGQHTIFAGRYYQLLVVNPESVEQLQLERMKGQTVRMEIVTRADRSTLLVSLRSTP